jgi:hypothetical protein
MPLSTSILPADGAYLNLWAWLTFFLGMWAYLALVSLTYCRLKHAAVSSAWLLLMLPFFHIGSDWALPGGLSFYPVDGLIALLPVVIGWSARDQDEPVRSTAKRGSP